MIRSDWSGTRPGEKMGNGIFKTGTLKRMAKMAKKKVYCKNCQCNRTIPLIGLIKWDYCYPTLPKRSGDNWNYKSTMMKMDKHKIHWMDELNKNNNCPYYKRQWWRVWVR